MSDYEQRQTAFAVFLLHRIAEAWGVSVPEAFRTLDGAGAIASYVLPCYDTLHTQGTSALVDDLTSYLRERGVEI